MMLPRTLSASLTSRCCPGSSRRMERGPAVVLKGARTLRWSPSPPSQSPSSSSIVASSSSSSTTSAASSPRPPSAPPLDPSVDARARHNAEQASTFNDAVEAFVETPAEVVPRLERIAEAARPALAAAFRSQPDSLLYPPRVLDVGAGTGCLIPPLLRVAGSERRKRRRTREEETEAGSEEHASSSSSSVLPMDYLAVDVSAGMLAALERIHGRSTGVGGGEEREEDKESSLLGNLPRIRTWLGDVESVPQHQAPFDACLLNAVFGNVHDQRSSLLAAALLLRAGTGRVVVGHPMGRRWHERLRATDAELVPHSLPGDERAWAELLRGLPLELVDANAAAREEREQKEEGAASAAAAERDGNGKASASSSSSSSASSSPRRLIVDDDDCYIAVLRVPPAWRLPATLYGTQPPPPAFSASPSSAAAGASAGGEENRGARSSSPTLQLLPQLLPRLPWQQGDGKGSERTSSSSSRPPPAPLPPLLLGGTVVKGFGRGSSKMGIPTANIDPEPLEEALAGVPDGVYFGWARLLPEEAGGEGGDGTQEEEDDENLDSKAHKCVLNVGRRPTFDGEEKGVGVLSVEVHVLHEFGRKRGGEEGGQGEEEKPLFVDFCGRELRVAATGFVRPEMRFPGVQALVSRIRSDVATASAALEEEEHAWARGHEFLWPQQKKDGE